MSKLSHWLSRFSVISRFTNYIHVSVQNRTNYRRIRKQVFRRLQSSTYSAFTNEPVATKQNSLVNGSIHFPGETFALFVKRKTKGNKAEEKKKYRRQKRKRSIERTCQGRYSNLSVSHACLYKVYVAFPAGKINMRIRSASEKPTGIISVHATGPRIFFCSRSNFAPVPGRFLSSQVLLKNAYCAVQVSCVASRRGASFQKRPCCR